MINRAISDKEDVSLLLGTQKAQFNHYLNNSRDGFIRMAWNEVNNMDDFIALIKSLPRLRSISNNAVQYLKLAESLNIGMPTSRSQIYRIIEQEKQQLEMRV